MMMLVEEQRKEKKRKKMKVKLMTEAWEKDVRFMKKFVVLGAIMVFVIVVSAIFFIGRLLRTW